MIFEIDRTLTSFVSIITIISAVIGTYIFAYKIGLKRGTRNFKIIARRNRYRLIYAPLRKLLIDKHISTARFIRYPYFSQRFKRSIPYIKKLQLKKSFKILADETGDNNQRSAGVDHGGIFPLDKIKEIVEINIEWADRKLIGLVQNADRAKYEEYYKDYNKPVRDERMMTNEELILADHIFDNFYELNLKLIG